MAQQTGATTRIVYDTETTYKTNPGSPDGMLLPFVSESVSLERAFVSSKTIRSSRQPQMPVRARINVAGDINFELAPEYGRLLKHIFGSGIKTGGSAPYTWTYKIATLPVGMVLEKQFPDLDTAKYFLYNGLKIGSFRLRGRAEGFLDASVSLIGAKETINSSAYDASVTDLGHTPFDGFEVTIKQGGAPLTEAVTEFEFTLDNALDDSIYAIGGAGQRSALREGIARVTGKLTAFFANDTLYALAVAGTETALEVDLQHGNGTGNPAGNEKLSFMFDEMKFFPKSPAITGPTGLLVELGFEAYYRVDADASACYAVLLTPVSAF
jgi:hypothetical protein